MPIIRFDPPGRMSFDYVASAIGAAGDTSKNAAAFGARDLSVSDQSRNATAKRGPRVAF
jgi:hypothetical protein